MRSLNTGCSDATMPTPCNCSGFQTELKILFAEFA